VAQALLDSKGALVFQELLHDFLEGLVVPFIYIAHLSCCFLNRRLCRLRDGKLHRLLVLRALVLVALCRWPGLPWGVAGREVHDFLLERGLLLLLRVHQVLDAAWLVLRLTRAPVVVIGVIWM